MLIMHDNGFLLSGAMNHFIWFYFFLFFNSCIYSQTLQLLHSDPLSEYWKYLKHIATWCKQCFGPQNIPLKQSPELCGAVGFFFCCYCMSNFSAGPNFFLSNIMTLTMVHWSLRKLLNDHVSLCSLLIINNIYFSIHKLSLDLASRSKVPCYLHSVSVR